MVELGGQFGGEGGVTGCVVGVVVLVGPVGTGQPAEQVVQPFQAGALPATPFRGTVDELQPGAVGAQQLPHGWFEFTVADQDDGMAERLSREGEAYAEGAGRGLHHGCSGA